MSHMIPSPDWFIGIDSFNLCVDGNWLDSITIEVDPLDAGTDNGFTFTAPNWATEPQGVIYRITSRYPAHPAGSFYYPYLKRLPPIATFQFIKLREYELNEIFHHSEDDKKYDVIGIEDQHMSQHNSIPVLNNNDIAEEIEEQRHEVELQMLNQSPKVLITTHSIAPTVETSHVLAPGVVRKGAKDVLLNSIVDSYHRHDEVPTMELVPKMGPYRNDGEVHNLGHHRNEDYPAYSSGSLATNNIDSIDRLIKYSNSRALKKHPKKIKPPRDCKVSDWGPWSPCNSSCGIGEMTRRRSITKHPRRGGQSCPPLLETKWCGGGKDCEQNKTKNSKPNEW
uniref:Spondin-2 n=3 Tax=Cacopsylla melanoneura TaxID=428564 RepID=A0A8D8PUM1_9HEMI